MKDRGTEHWNAPNSGVTNESGFTGLPGGYRDGAGRDYYDMGDYAHFWSTTDLGFWDHVSHWALLYDGQNFSRVGYNKEAGISVRCVKD